MKHALRIGAMLAGAAFLFTLLAFPSLLVGLAFGLLAGVPAALLTLAVSRNPMPARYDPDDDGGAYELHPPAAYQERAAAPQPVTVEDDDDFDGWADDGDDQCTPSRNAKLTGELGDRERTPLPELIERTEDELIRALIGVDELPAVEEEQSIAVPDWPIRQPVRQDEKRGNNAKNR